MSALVPFYPWLKALHILAVIAWMAGLLYLPRLFVYHAGTASGSEASETFKVMECRLSNAIMLPAMLGTWLFGILLALTPGVVDWHQGWIHAKLALVVWGADLLARKERLGQLVDSAADRHRRPGGGEAILGFDLRAAFR